MMLNNLLSSWFSVVTIPTHFTLARIIMVPFMVSAMMANQWTLATILFIAAALTDVIDGALARSLNQVSVLGSCLDPLADKLFLISCFAGLTFTRFSTFTLPFWFVTLILLNEIVLVMCATYWGIIKQTIVIKPTQLGRLTGLGQILFIGWMFLCGFTGSTPVLLFYILLTLMVISRACALLQYAHLAYTKRCIS